MSHVYAAPGGSYFNHNSDLSGGVIITLRNGSTLDVPGEDLLAFVAYRWVLRERIRQLEGMDWRALLGEPAPVSRELADLRTYQADAADRFAAVVQQRDAAEAEVKRLQGLIHGLADRVAGQSEILSRRAERPPPVG